MDEKEAAQKIDEIHSILQSSNRAFFSWKGMVLIGVMCLLIPLAGISTQWFTFGHDFSPHQWRYLTIVICLSLWGLGALIYRLFSLKWQGQKYPPEALHPNIRRAFSIKYPWLASVIGLTVVFSLADLGMYIYPLFFIFLGLLYFVLGQFTVPALKFIAWSFIFVGLLFFYLAFLGIPYLYVYLNVYQGLSFLGMGYFLWKAEKTNA